MPAEIEWKNLVQKDDVPTARSGHTLNCIGGVNYFLYGGIEDSKNGKIQPDPNCYQMRLLASEVKWTKLQPGGDAKPLARSQHIALSSTKFDKVFIFGGHNSPQARLNDTWFYHVKENEWRCVGDPKNTSNSQSEIGAPGPRANMGACLYKGKIYIFGGHGGIGYARVAYNDLYSFDLETEIWSKVVSNNPAPDGRGGHSLFANNDKLYIYGGWNSEMQYNNVLSFDLEKGEWGDPDIYNEVPRWNHSSVLVEAIPFQKFFVFGGECAEYTEGAARSFGSYVNTSCLLDLGIMRWNTIASDPDVFQNIPSPREYSAIAYDDKDRRLIILGGWNNGWHSDIYSLNVGKIVGPPYAITRSDPALGQLSGNVPLKISGQGFRDTGIRVMFTVGNKPVDTMTRLTMEVAGVYVSPTELTCVTPNFEIHGPKECVIQLQIGVGDLTTTWIPFNYFLNTRALKSLAYGPGLLSDVAINAPVEFIIQGRNDLGENRTSGRDHFEVKIFKKIPLVDGEEKQQFGQEISCTIKDLQDGQYFCTYTVNEECQVEVKIEFEDDRGKMVPLRGSPYSASFTSKAKAADNTMIGGAMAKYIAKELESLNSSFAEIKKAISTKDKESLKDVKTLLNIKEKTENTLNQAEETNLQLDQLEESLKKFQDAKQAKDSQVKSLAKINKDWNDLKKQAKDVKKEIQPMVTQENERNKANIKKLEDDITQFTQDMRKREFFQYKCGTKTALQKLDGVFSELTIFEDNIKDFGGNAEKFGVPDMILKAEKDIEAIKITVDNMKILWDHIDLCQRKFEQYMSTRWIETKPFEMEDEVKKLKKTLTDFKVDKRSGAYNGINDEIKKWLNFLPLIAELADPSMRPRHWDSLQKKINAKFTIDDQLVLRDIYNLNLDKYKEDVEEITDQARQEAKMEKTLAKFVENWKDILFEFTPYKDSGVYQMKLNEDNTNMLEENQVAVTSMTSSRYFSTFEQQITYWNKSLAAVSEVNTITQEVFRTWSFLEGLFIHSEEVKKELPKESIKFIEIDKSVKAILTEAFKIKKPLEFCILDHIFPGLEKAQQDLSICEKALNEFLETKKLQFPRFFFVSTTDLLDILSNGNVPSKIMVHMPKIISAIETLELIEEGVRPFAKSIHSYVGVENVAFTEPLKLMGKVEVYLQDVIDTMRKSLLEISRRSLKKFGEIDKETWLKQDPAMVTLLINCCQWVVNVEKGFSKIPTKKDAMRDIWDAQCNDLKGLIMMAQGDLSRPMRQKIMCMITMDAHSRDIIDLLYEQKVMRVDEFQWQTQLKGMYDTTKQDFFFRIADACLAYGYEYLGNGPRLVITPLTDRIYVTATQALHLKMGCAPAGPAGTGKTESTKDLANALAKACYVFNCSDQMDYKGMAGIFKGLAASGSWGCFDEFNRLVPEVLSVCSVQFKSVTDAIRQGASRFVIQGDEVSLDPTCGAFITMNPGYLGRSELPEGLKALFRPITVVVPDLELICENMLMAEGFVTAKGLAKKFTTLYFLCRDLLSKAPHYDWGLRAIKSVLVVAGGMKRDEPSLQEEAILLRALRDFNLPKIVADDLDIFFGLLGDLFPGIEVSRKRDMRMEDIITATCKSNLLHPDPDFILKVVQLQELLAIRHCVFVMGPPGAGKSSTWKILGKAQDADGQKTTINDLNPKVTSTNELYGVVLMATREWKDGLLSKTMRTLGQIPDTNPKWIVLDGDLDANWIESMNSVMDDNKLLTLASNERIPLKPHMRMIFEIRDLRFATPATVSRAGILFISDTLGTQWRSYVKSWIKQLKTQEPKKVELETLFEKYVPDTLFHCAKSFKHIIPQVQMALVMSMCKLIENLLLTNDVKGLEYIFVFACIWCIGGGYIEKDGKDFKKDFSNWWKEKWKIIKFPSKGTVFDYYVDIENSKLEEWSKMSGEAIDIDTSKAIPNYTIPTTDTISAQFLIKQFIQINHSPMLCGQAGCGKTQIIKGLLQILVNKTEDYLQQIINFNYYTDANLLQMIMEQQLEKKAGKTYAPLGKYKLLYFVDDLNMQQKDPYDTQNAISLLRQQKDYEHWYDKNKLTLKDIKMTQMVAAMNPSAGSNIVDPRLQRHFWLLAIGLPEQTSLSTIYSAFLTKHFSTYKGTIQEQINPVIKGTLLLHSEITRQFRKTATNFHYEFNVRHLTNVFQGLLTAKKEAIKEPDNFIRLWVHEAERIYGDRLVSPAHLAIYRATAFDLVSKNFSKFNLKRYFGATPEPLVFAKFVASLDDTLYDQFQKPEDLALRLGEALREYNDLNAVMDLVLFEDAMKHVCKIARIISADQGHALLVGVGGSGKQSLSRLSSFICKYNTVSIMISSSYSVNDLKADLQIFYNKAGVKDEGIMFLLTEGQITNERFLVLINDLLSSGEIPDLFPLEDVDSIVNAIRPAVKGEGILDSKDNCWKFFIDRVKRNLHMSLCFSPVGDLFRQRATRFPAIINCTVIDWFHPWPEDALLDVAKKFLSDVEMASDDIRTGIQSFMPYSFKVVDEFSKKIFEAERRYVYTTPKSFLELIKLFKVMLGKKEGELLDNKEKYETGVIKLTETGEVVSKLEEELKVFAVEVEAAKKSADEQAEIVGKEKTKVEAQNAVAEEEAAKCFEIQTTVEAKMNSVEADLALALPLVEKAQEALAGLKIDDFRNLKALKTPPAAIAQTFEACLQLLVKINPDIPMEPKTGKLKTEKPWAEALKAMANPQGFLDQLNSFKALIDEEKVASSSFKYIRPTLADPTFTKEIIMGKSSAAGGLCDWIINITAYYDVVVTVEPKKMAVAEAKAQLAAANEKKAVVDALVADLNAKLQVLLDAYQKAMDEKNNAMAQAEKCERKMNLAQRLVGALGSELERWQQSIIDLGELLKVIIGDVLMASAFVSYVGPFNKRYRDMILLERFVPYFKKNNIPMSSNPNPLLVLTDEATIAGWNNFGLPPDRVSTENGAILTSSERYSLIIDPQLQGILWLRKTWDSKGLKVTRLSNPKMVKTIEASVEQGFPVLIENLENSIDAVIQPVYARAIIKKGKTKYIKMGDKELTLSNEFKLFLHTKLSNPHYPPEIQAECTLINFTVTEAGLEDQLLSLVVKKERPDLAAQKEELIQQQNGFKIKLKELETGLLKQLAEAQGDILENVPLIESLEFSKKLSTEIQEKVEIAKETEININSASEAYRPAASRGALVFFLMNELYMIHSFYKFSLDSFVIVVNRAIDIVAAEARRAKQSIEDPVEGDEGVVEAEAQPEEEEPTEMSPEALTARVEALLQSITFQGFNYSRRGTFEDHKLIISTMLTFRILIRQGKVLQSEYDALIKKEVALDLPHQAEGLKFIPEAAWGAVKGLETIKVFEHIIQQMEGESHLWRKWYSDERPESCEMPKSCKDISLFHRLLLLRALRPDRLTNALREYVQINMGIDYIESPPFDVVKTYDEMNPQTPVFFVLFPGVDPTPDVEFIGKMNKKIINDGTFINISMGQGQEENAIKALKDAGKAGNWVMFQNVHLMQTWMKSFERNFEIVIEEGAHPDFRCFVSSEPPPSPEMEIIPESILQNSLKVANEAPKDLKSNIRRAFSKFDESHFEKSKSHKHPEFKALLFGLCMFHSLILGRAKFGAQGWSRKYNFNDGDLRICGDVLHNYLAAYEQVPYADLQYLYGEIMYGGHITDDWDRRTNNTYLQVLVKPDILKGMNLTLAPGFRSPDPLKFDRPAYVSYVNDKLPPEIPQMFGLHPNAEIGYLTSQGENLCFIILACSGGSGGGGAGRKDQVVKEIIDRFLSVLPQGFNMIELNARAKDRSPYVVVCLQECERMNILTETIRMSLSDLDAGLAGSVNINDDMERLSQSLFINVVPAQWAAVAYFSKKDLPNWFDDLLLRIKQLQQYSEDLMAPKSIWISGLFNPMSYLTAIMQVTARRDNLPLDNMTLKTDITNTRDPHEIPEPADNGAFIHGFYIQGASWEIGRGGEQGNLAEMLPKELYPELPVVHVTAIDRKNQVSAGYYKCPVYVTSMRGPTYVFTANLKMESDEFDAKLWILAGVALVMLPE